MLQKKSMKDDPDHRKWFIFSSTASLKPKSLLPENTDTKQFGSTRGKIKQQPNFVNYFKILATTAALKMLKSMLAALVHILGFYRLNSY